MIVHLLHQINTISTGVIFCYLDLTQMNSLWISKVYAWRHFILYLGDDVTSIRWKETYRIFISRTYAFYFVTTESLGKRIISTIVIIICINWTANSHAIFSETELLRSTQWIYKFHPCLFVHNQILYRNISIEMKSKMTRCTIINIFLFIF